MLLLMRSHIQLQEVFGHYKTPVHQLQIFYIQALVVLFSLLHQVFTNIMVLTPDSAATATASIFQNGTAVGAPVSFSPQITGFLDMVTNNTIVTVATNDTISYVFVGNSTAGSATDWMLQPALGGGNISILQVA